VLQPQSGNKNNESLKPRFINKNGKVEKVERLKLIQMDGKGRAPHEKIIAAKTEMSSMSQKTNNASTISSKSHVK